MLTLNANGLYCELGNFYIDPIRPVETAIITHGHADHARWGMETYIATPPTCDIMKIRLGPDIQTIAYPFDQPFEHNGVRITLIPAGHILGSAQVKIETHSQTAIVTGDFKTEADPTVEVFRPTPCDLFVMETTFGLPIYHWPSPASVLESIHSFWKANQSEGIATVLYAYSLGKAQRLVNGLDPTVGPIAVHPAVKKMNDIYLSYKRLSNDPPVAKQ